MTLASNYQCLVGNKCKNVFINNHLMVIKVDIFFFFWLHCKKKERKFTGNFQPIHDPFFMEVCAKMVIQLIVFLSFHLKCFLLIFLFCISVSKFPFKAVSIHFLSLFKQQWQTFAVSGSRAEQFPS